MSLSGWAQAAEAHDDALESVDLVQVPVIGALEDGVLELGGRVFDLVGLVEEPVYQRVQEGVEQVTRMPLADVALVVGDALLDGFEDLLVVFVEGDDPVLGGDDGDLLAARVSSSTPMRTARAMARSLSPCSSNLGRKVAVRMSSWASIGMSKKAPTMWTICGVGDAEDLDPDHALFAGETSDRVQVGEFLHLAVGFVVGDDPELGRDGRLEGGGGRQLAGGAADFGVFVGGLTRQGAASGLSPRRERRSLACAVRRKERPRATSCWRLC
jgi:hypothetical protein